MTLVIPQGLFEELVRHLEAAYPEEGAGLLLGEARAGLWVVHQLFPVANQWQQQSERRRRYQIPPQVVAQAEDQAEARGLWLLGVYHSHPDHPSQPSAFDRQWALPQWVYLIARVERGRVGQVQAWRLREDRTAFQEVPLRIL